MDPIEFDYRIATREQILGRALLLVGRRLSDALAGPITRAVSSISTKGSVGALYEAFFGIPANNLPEPDFPGAHIELKSVPIITHADIPRIKERTFVTGIDYKALADEEWVTASVRKKTQEVLLIFYEWRPDTDIAEFATRSVLLWTPSIRDLGLMKLDWTVVRDKVRSGEAHRISEGDGYLLGAATKAATGSVRVRQPYSAVPARRRAWALKPSLTRSILADALSDRPVESVLPSAGELAPTSFEDVTLARLRPYVGRKLGSIVNELGIGSLTGKAKGAIVVRRALGLQERSRVIEFERVGLEVKTVRLSPAGRPYEAMSFPAFRYRELADEAWPDSDFLSRLNRLLIVPLIGAMKSTSFDDCVLDAPFFWSPTEHQLEGIEREWTAFRDEIRNGRALDLTPESRTKFIHVRPKARDSRDTDLAPVVGPAVKKCFWLNKGFVESIIRDERDRTSPSRHGQRSERRPRPIDP